MVEKLGRGGNIKVSSNSKIYAYNGNECTLNESDAGYYYKPLEIFAQNGILRKFYKYSHHWGEEDCRTYSYWRKILGNSINITSDVTPTSSKETMVNVLIRDEGSCSESGYINSANGSKYGIGSGAGYLEIDNGQYGIDASFN